MRLARALIELAAVSLGLAGLVGFLLSLIAIGAGVVLPGNL